MNWKELLMTAIAVTLGMILYSIVKTKLPAGLGGDWESD